MRIIEDKSLYGRVDVFEEVTEFPIGYQVWAIGRENFPYERCIPLCKGTIYQVDLKSLKFLELPSEELALKVLDYAVSHGVNYKNFELVIKE